MRKNLKYKPINLKKALARMKQYAKEKDRRCREQKKLAEKVFGPLVRKLKSDS